MADPTKAAQNINNANMSQASQALLIQTYANSVNEQPNVDFSGDPSLASFQMQINMGLQQAQGHANHYLDDIQPRIITNIANISNYYVLNNAVPANLPLNATAADWINELGTLQTMAQQFQKDAQGVVSLMMSLATNVSTDVGSFAQTVNELNTAVNGDNGALAALNQQLSSIQGQIDVAIAGVVTSGLAIIGGSFLIVVGGVADFVTAGTSTPLVLAGVGIVVTGVAVETGSAIALSDLNDEKAAILGQEAQLMTEVVLATGISNGYQTLSNQAQTAVEAASQMANAWEFLSTDLGSMINDLQNGLQSVDQIRTLFLTAANQVVPMVLADINTIKDQMTGATTIVAPPGQTVGQAILTAAGVTQ